VVDRVVTMPSVARQGTVPVRFGMPVRPRKFGLCMGLLAIALCTAACPANGSHSPAPTRHASSGKGEIRSQPASSTKTAGKGALPPSSVRQCITTTSVLSSIPDDFYRQGYAATPQTAPGDLECANQVSAPRPYRAWVFIYWSWEYLSDKPVAVSGSIAVNPQITAPPAGRPLLSWAHETFASITDGCALSHALPTFSAYPLVLSQFLDANDGFAVVGTDYQGLGMPGVHPYLVGKDEAYAVLFAARAAQRFRPAQASGPVIVMGHSQGGHAALFADYMANHVSYRFGVKFRPKAVIALSAPTDLLQLASFAVAHPSPSLVANTDILLAAGAWHRYYGVRYPDVLTEAGQAAADAETDPNTTDCYVPDVSETGDWIRSGEFTGPWPGLLADNSVEADSLSPSIPVLIVQGTSDAQVLYTLTRAAVQTMCAHSTPVTYWEIMGGSHDDPKSDGRILPWAQRIVRGEAVKNTC
jgi:pimeloyl-ACP methyl ester carboxylesterase